MPRKPLDASYTLCWSCANAYANKCERFKTKKRPLAIWEECKIVNLYYAGKTVKSYFIQKCTNYIAEDYRIEVRGQIVKIKPKI